MVMEVNYSPEQNDSFSPEITYTWWCPRCKVDHYTPYCPMAEYERLVKSWENSRYYKFCPHCGQLVRQGD